MSAGGGLREPGLTLMNYKGDNISKYVYIIVKIDTTRKMIKFVNLNLENMEAKEKTAKHDTNVKNVG